MSGGELVAAILASGVLGGGSVGGVMLKVMNRRIDAATANATNATAEATRSAGKKDDLDVLRGIIEELRENETRKDERIGRLERRMNQLEERERHMLTRAAVHEAWDQMAFAFIVSHDQTFPQPPPLSAGEHDD